MFNYNELKEMICSRKARIAVWGCGFVGMTNMLYLIKKDFRCIGIDVNKERIKEINKGVFNINSDLSEIGCISKENLSKMSVTDDYKNKNVSCCDVHILCLPTEKNFKPCSDYVEDVINKIAEISKKQILIIIECSMPSTWIDKCIVNILKRHNKEENIDFILGAAPRRDLFGEKEFNLRKTPRVIAANNDNAKEVVSLFYKTYCDNVVMAKDCYHAVLSKTVENTYRCFDISLANQLNYYLKDFDMTHVLELASTKWNVEKYHPSFGIGGYCIPLAPQYILEELEGHGSKSEIFEEIMAFNDNSARFALEKYIPLLSSNDNVLILGLSSIPNVGITNCSIGIKLTKELQKFVNNVVVNDPFINSDLLERVTGCIAIDNFIDISFYDVIFVICQHDIYRQFAEKIQFKSTAIIIDSFGIWKDVELLSSGISYYEVGRIVK